VEHVLIAPSLKSDALDLLGVYLGQVYVAVRASTSAVPGTSLAADTDGEERATDCRVTACWCLITTQGRSGAPLEDTCSSVSWLRLAEVRRTYHESRGMVNH
jgi:hypothetical protein